MTKTYLSVFCFGIIALASVSSCKRKSFAPTTVQEVEAYLPVKGYRVEYTSNASTPSRLYLKLRLPNGQDTVVLRSVPAGQIGSLVTMLNDCVVGHQLIKGNYEITPKNEINGVVRK